MQKRLLHIYFVAIATMLMLQLTSCSQDEISIQSSSPNIQVIGRIPNYNPYYVNTKADDNGKTVEESAIKYMALLTFNTMGKLIDTQQLQGSAAIFVIDRDILATRGDLTKSSMYLIANIDQSQAAGWHIEDIDDLENLVYKTSLTSVGIPSTGIPMIGKIENFDLSPNATIAGDKIQIELELLYAKIEFNLTLNATQIEPQTPSFYVRSCVAYNLPKGVHLVDNVDEDNNNQTKYFDDVIAEGINIPITGNRELTNMNSLAFTFYMPEHQVNPSKTGEQVYPAGISSDIEKQRYKPLFVEDDEGNYYDGKPAYVLINGIYTDHQNQEHLVTYKVYLGSNAIDNFHVVRNGRYVNDVTIKGITNSIDATEGSVSLDHRVNVTRNDFIVFMEREAMLDSHFEVRPIRVRINSDENGDPKGTVRVEIADDCDWIRLEKSNSNNGDALKYCDNGKRKYFTTTLFDNSDLGESTSCDIISNDNNCVWLYIDEYVEILDLTGKTDDEQIAAMVAEQQRKKRSTTITITYTPTNGGPEEVEVTKYQFIQRCIYPVMTTVNNPLYNRRNDDGTPYIYYIEFFEEYLHNFDSNDGFGLTDYDGISWGLEDLPISSQYQAAFIDESSQSFLLRVLKFLGIDTEAILNQSIGTLETAPQYDFYLSRDKAEKGLPDGITIRDYSGKDFTHEILTVAKNNGKLSAGTLDAEPESAAEYCYNKNKRDDNNLLSKENMHWYMPSIDEIEDIVTSAHFDFPVFQDNFYWSSQPAYIANDFKINVDLIFSGSATGKYYNDHPNRARATKVEWGQTEPTKSGTNGSYGEQTYLRGWSSTEDTGYKEYSTSVTFDDGNKARTEEHRVRAVYMP